MLQKTVTLLLLATSLTAMAQSSGQGLKPSSARDAYVEVSLNSLNYAQTGMRLSPTALRTVVGKNINATFSYEGMLGVGTSQGSATVGTTPAYAKIDPFFGAYLKVRKELAPGLEVFGRFGAASVVKKLDGTYFPGAPTSERMGSVSYGLGVKVRVRRDINFVTDYTSYYNRKQETIDGLSLGFAFDY